MTTANATTNSVGNSAYLRGDLGLSGAIESFKISPIPGGSAPFLPEHKFKRYGIADTFVGDLIDSNNAHFDIIGRSLHESGVSLRTPAIKYFFKPPGKRDIFEVWTLGWRYRVISGRVYREKRSETQ
jgi:hypothetical protein